MPTRERLGIFARYAVDRTCVLRSLKVALFVGTVLALINHYDALLSGYLSATRLSQILLTYAVPYCVATFGSASQAAQMEFAASQRVTASETFGDASSSITIISSPNNNSEGGLKVIGSS